ncbi:MAG: hypothetical protein BroJett040_04330 [Oligoflexia bacterium]|nr:MAG: hypothetical protein BroJett040_04330 [Oligoflexia bacterium]
MKSWLSKFIRTIFQLIWEVSRLFILLIPISLPSAGLFYFLNQFSHLTILDRLPLAVPLTLFTLYLTYFVGHLLWPIMMILLFPVSRLRDPKYIIRLGERFRKLKLSAPQIFIIRNSGLHFLNNWPVLGFFVLPKPFGASIFMTQSAFDKLKFLDFDETISQYAVRARYHRWTSPALVFGTTTLILYSVFFLFHKNIEPHLLMNFDGALIKNISLGAIAAVISLAITYFTKKSQSLETTYQLHRIQDSSDLEYPRPSKSIILIRAYTLVSFLLFGLSTVLLSLNTQVQNQLSEVRVPKIQFEFPKLLSSKSEITKAIEEKNHRKVMLLIGQEKDRQLEPTLNNATPLLVAAQNSDLKTIYLLLMVGHSLDEVDDEGRNIFFYALQSPDRMRVLKYLLQTKANRNHQDKNKMTPLDYAREKKLADAEALLLSEPSQEPKKMDFIEQASKLPASASTESQK